MSFAADPRGSKERVILSVPDDGSNRVSRRRLLWQSGLSLACLIAAAVGYLLDAPARFSGQPASVQDHREALESFVRGVLIQSGASLLLLSVLASSTGALLTSVFLWSSNPGQSLRAVFHGTVLGAAGLIGAIIFRFGIGPVWPDVIVTAGLVVIGAVLAQQASWSLFRCGRFILLLCILIGGIGAGLFYFATTSRPLERSERSTMTPEDAQRIEVIRDTVRNSSIDGTPVELALTSRDLQLLGSRFMARAKRPIDWDVRISDGMIQCLLIARPTSERFLRIEFDLSLILPADSMQPDFDVTKIQCGPMTLPRTISYELSRALNHQAPEIQPVQNVLAVLDEVWMTADAIHVLGDFDASLVMEIWEVEGSSNDDLIRSVQDCGRYLLEQSADLPRGDERLEALLQLAFKWANGTNENHSRVSRNRAALLALAAMVGSNDIAQVIQRRTAGALPQFEYRFTKFITARERTDLAKHLVATAGLAAWTSQSASETVGLLKEEWDAARGGSGFSFADFQADCAGARLGYLATRDEATARQIQEQIIDGVSISDILPDVDGLPENISAEMLQREFGGIEGDGFRRWEAEVERRLDEVPLLQAPQANSTTP